MSSDRNQRANEIEMNRGLIRSTIGNRSLMNYLDMLESIQDLQVAVWIYQNLKLDKFMLNKVMAVMFLLEEHPNFKEANIRTLHKALYGYYKVLYLMYVYRLELDDVAVMDMIEQIQLELIDMKRLERAIREACHEKYK